MKWVQLRRAGVCAFGCQVSRRSWVLLGRRGYRSYGRHFLVCAPCAEQHYRGLQPPAIDPSTLARDGKAAALGSQE